MRLGGHFAATGVLLNREASAAQAGSSIQDRVGGGGARTQSLPDDRQRPGGPGRCAGTGAVVDAPRTPTVPHLDRSFLAGEARSVSSTDRAPPEISGERIVTGRSDAT